MIATTFRRPLLPIVCCIAACYFTACGPERKQQETVYRPSPALLEKAFDTFREESISKRRFKHEDIEPLILKRKSGNSLEVEALGKSVEQRTIYQLRYGSGPVKVMLWSQMHGDESTATMALLDLFNFLEAGPDEFDSLRTLLAENTSLYFIPMLNPDGAEAFKRRNAYGFDLNRDAIRAESPEAQILKETREKLTPEFGFNLHDQSIYYNVKGTPVPATISVLAPAFDEEVSMNEVRKSAMQVIVGMNELLQRYIPGGVGKYDDSFYPRAFGDNFQKWGTSTILIESGGYKDDPEKQFIRKLNFMVILRALTDIATGAYQHYSDTRYFDIPDNDRQLTDLVIRNLHVNRDERSYLTDISMQQGGPADVSKDASAIIDVGDLSVAYGYQELDAAGFEWQAGRLYEEKTFASPAEIDRDETLSLLKQGYSAVRVKSLEPAAAPPRDTKAPAAKVAAGDTSSTSNASGTGNARGKDSADSAANADSAKSSRPGESAPPEIPPLIMIPETDYEPSQPLIGQKATFFISKNGTPHYAVIRGRLIELQKTKNIR